MVGVGKPVATVSASLVEGGMRVAAGVCGLEEPCARRWSGVCG